MIAKTDAFDSGQGSPLIFSFLQQRVALSISKKQDSRLGISNGSLQLNNATIDLQTLRGALPLEHPKVFEGIGNSKNKRDGISAIPLRSDLFSSLGHLFLVRLLLSRASLRFSDRGSFLINQDKKSMVFIFKRGIINLKQRGIRGGNKTNFFYLIF